MIQGLVLDFLAALVFWSYLPFILVPAVLVASFAAGFRLGRPYLPLVVLAVGWALVLIRTTSFLFGGTGLAVGLIGAGVSFLVGRKWIREAGEGNAKVDQDAWAAAFEKRPNLLPEASVGAIGMVLALQFAPYMERPPRGVHSTFTETWVMLEGRDRTRFENLDIRDQTYVHELPAEERADAVNSRWRDAHPDCRYGRDSDGSCYSQQDRELQSQMMDLIMSQ